ncbi:MAG TPA: AI-2E family transporter [Candidatus Bathyarchaeia archaeon]|nr:AI-2E family transporter [Candidatus Bathyarchaeia archaeon]
MVRKVEVSHRTIVFTVLFLVFLWLLYQIKDIIFNLFIAFVMMAALNSSVEKMEKIKIPRPIAIIMIYLVFFGFISVVIAGVIPPLVDQTSTLINKIPNYVKEINLPWLNKEAILSQFSSLASIPENLVKLTVNVFRNILAIFVLAVINFYLLMERKNLGKYLTVLFGGDGHDRAAKFIERLEGRLGSWVRAELLLMTIIGVMSYIGLRILGIDFALPLAVFAGFLEVVPNIGPTISAIPAVISGLTISPLYGLAVLALYFLIQQVENSIIVPKVMEKGLGLNPLVVIVCLAVGLRLGGIIGMILAIPVFLVIQEISSEIVILDRFSKNSKSPGSL